jgi:hypothetical protein
MNNKRHARVLDLRFLQDGPENIKERSPLCNSGET